MGRNLKKTNRFIDIYNDIVAFPTMSDVAEEAGLSLSRAKSLVSEIRRRNKDHENGLKTIGSRVAAGRDQDRVEKEEVLQPGQMVDNLGRRVPKSDEVREYREDWTDIDCIKHLRSIADMLSDEAGHRVHMTRNLFRNNSSISDSTWNRYFGSFSEFRRQADLELSRHAHGIERAIGKHASKDEMQRVTDMKRSYAGKYERPDNGKRFKTILVGTDFHGTKCDPFVRRMFVEANRRIQPDVINMNGDFFDLADFSKYTSDPREFDVMSEIHWNHKLLEELREDNADAQLDFIEGNHEYRLFRHLGEQTPALKVLLCDLHGMDIPQLLGLDRYEVNFTGQASLKAFTESDVKKELSRNFKIYWDCLLSCHYPERRKLRIPGWGGHYHKHEVWPFFNPFFGACEFHQMGGGQRRRADFMDGEIWQNGIMVVHCDTQTRQSVFEYIPIQDHCVLGGQYYFRTADEKIFKD